MKIFRIRARVNGNNRTIRIKEEQTMKDLSIYCSRRNSTLSELLEFIYGLYGRLDEGVIREYLWTTS